MFEEDEKIDSVLILNMFGTIFRNEEKTMSTTEEERVRQIKKNRDKANRAGRTLGWDPETRTVRLISDSDLDHAALAFVPPDLKHSVCWRVE